MFSHISVTEGSIGRAKTLARIKCKRYWKSFKLQNLIIPNILYVNSSSKNERVHCHVSSSPSERNVGENWK